MLSTRKPSEIANNLANKIYKNLDTETFSNGKWCKTISNKMLELIRDELYKFLGEISLTEVEQAIFNQADLDQFAMDMAGSYHALRSSGAICNIPYGITTIELTDTYFKAIKYRNFLAAWINDLPYSEDGITYDILNSDTEARKRAVLLSFGNNLIKRASLEQCNQLYIDLDKKKSFMNTLLTPDDAISSWFMTTIYLPLCPTYSLNSYLTDSQNKRLSSSYTNSLFFLRCFSELLCILLSGKKGFGASYRDVINSTVGFFCGKDQVIKLAKALPCVNTTLAKAKQEEQTEVMSKSYNRKRSL